MQSLADCGIGAGAEISIRKVACGGGTATSDAGSFDDERDDEMRSETAAEDGSEAEAATETAEVAAEVAAEAAAARNSGSSERAAYRPGVAGLLNHNALHNIEVPCQFGPDIVG